MSYRSLPYVDPGAARGPLQRSTMRLLGSRVMVALERSLPFRLVAWRLTPRLLRLSGGRVASLLPFPADVLETRDARDGRPHRRAVVYFHDGDRVTLIPSRAGMAADPFWFQNALADPAVRFGERPYRAEAVEDPEAQARLWRLAEAAYPPNVTHRQDAARRGRTIPILQLTPR
ncbi:MAG TPA: nitroreductase/quinone reductase family protein [Conexibacter sp.]|nr:nitroreductase/quinone reductase family protein [Conexibacter sp.]